MINVTIIGLGYVGSSLALLLLNNQYSIKLNIMEPNPACKGAYLDLIHGIPLYTNKILSLNDNTLLSEADFIFYTAGMPNLHGNSRLSTAQQNIKLSRVIFEHRSFTKTPYIIVITNPVDLISYAIYQFTGLPSNKVIGTGTFLDSTRLSYYLSAYSSYSPYDFNTMVLGEHGDTQVPIFSNCTIKAKPLLSHSEFTEKSLIQIAEQTKNAAFEIRKTQVGTTYGVAKCAEMILSYLLGKKTKILALSVLTTPYYRNLLNLDQDIYISLPVKINNGNITLHNQIELSNRELTRLQESAQVLAQLNQHYFTQNNLL